ncbi:hypothetical protein DWV00_24145 [Trinickia dinghuensis]|uniref:Uncharacterized protein n=1 Tax=Trinickia dinghuensis TaxID=2291023 RepID=A0A3D8JSV0_9BURK|nr:hypothetical protein DWV00_24145 [Trinickia dinghuensis]
MPNGKEGKHFFDLFVVQCSMRIAGALPMRPMVARPVRARIGVTHPTCPKRTRVSEKAKKASEFVNRPTGRTTRIEPSTMHAGTPLDPPARRALTTDTPCRIQSRFSRRRLPTATPPCARPFFGNSSGSSRKWN